MVKGVQACTPSEMAEKKVHSAVAKYLKLAHVCTLYEKDARMTIEQIRELCSNSKIEVTGHMLQCLSQRHISFSEVKEVIMNGEVIEDYPDDYPYPSCLVFGYTIEERIIHTVVGVGDSKLWLITAYEPDPEQWTEDFRVRKEQS